MKIRRQLTVAAIVAAAALIGVLSPIGGQDRTAQEKVTTEQQTTAAAVTPATTQQQAPAAEEKPRRKLGPDKDYDTKVLRHNASFEIEVADGVWWVPANALGRSDMTNDQIKALDRNDPEKVKESIDTLYEVIQYIQAHDFKGTNDNIRTYIQGEGAWEHHKPGRLAVTTNEGCCATISNLLNYLLEGDYEEVGFITYTFSDGGGHVFNYIRHEGYYYFVDLTNYRNDFLVTSVEEGDIYKYWSSGGHIHKAERAEDFVEYCIGLHKGTVADSPVLSSIYVAENVLPVRDSGGEWIDVPLPESAKDIVRIVYDDPDDNVRYVFVPGPREYPKEWEPYNTKW